MNRRVGEIDLLRFIAALMVVFFHYTFRGHAADGLSDIAFPEFSPVSMYGYLGVELFFMISGFVILMTASSGSLRKFAISRIVRLYPAYWIGCSLSYIAILALGQGRFEATFSQYLINLTMLNEFIYVPSIDGVYWSLAVEIKFYILVGCLLFFGQIPLIQRYLIAWIAATALLEIFPNQLFRSILITQYAPFFIIGAFSFLVYSNGWTPIRKAALVASWLLALNSSVAASVQYGQKYQTHYEPAIVIILVSVFTATMVLISIHRTGAMALRNWAPVGALTYPLYLIHQNIGFMIFNYLGALIERHALLALTLAMMLGIAYYMHKSVERPFSTYLKRWLDHSFSGKVST